MNVSLPRLSRTVAASLLGVPLVLLGASTRAADEPEAARLLHDEAGAAVAVEGQREIRIANLTGKVLLRTGKPGELRYEARAREDRKAERPVGLWLRGGSFELGALPGAPVEPLWVEMAIPPELSVEVDLDGAAVEVAGMHSNVVVRGSKLELDARGIYGRVYVDAADSTIGIDGVDGDVQVEGKTLRLKIRNVSTGATVNQSGGDLDVSDVRGGADLDVSNAVVRVKQLEEGLRLSASSGSVELQEIRKEIDLNLSDAPAVLSACDARITIESNGEVRFKNVTGIVSFAGVGASLQSAGGRGPLEISTSGAAVTIESQNGGVKIDGDGLTVELREITGDVNVETTSSEVHIEKVSGAIAVTNDFGDVRLSGAASTARIVNLDGSVYATEIGGLLDVHGRGERVEVDWSAMAGTGQHSIVNETGDVVARLPANSRCRIEVESTNGHVESEFPTVLVTEDRRFASGVLGQSQEPLVQIRSGGDVLLTGTPGKALPTQ